MTAEKAIKRALELLERSDDNTYRAPEQAKLLAEQARAYAEVASLLMRLRTSDGVYR